MSGGRSSYRYEYAASTTGEAAGGGGGGVQRDEHTAALVRHGHL
jgi:hypothetical protein